MDPLDPFAFLTPGVRLELELESDRLVVFFVETAVEGAARVWCHPAAAEETRGFLLEHRVLNLFIPDPSGPLKIPVLPTSESLQSSAADPTGLTCFKILPGTIRLQRRHFFRLANPPITFSIRSVGGADASTDPFVLTQVRNLGAGGAAVVVESSGFLVGDGVELLLSLSATTQISAKGDISRTTKLFGDRMLLAIRFNKIQERDRDLIVAMLFREQTRRFRMEK